MSNKVDKMIKESDETGRIWVIGEMEFDTDKGPAFAYHQAAKIAEACGYMVGWKYGYSAFSVTGPEIIGQYVFDWFDPEAKRLVKIEAWSAVEAYSQITR